MVSKILSTGDSLVSERTSDRDLPSVISVNTLSAQPRALKFVNVKDYEAYNAEGDKKIEKESLIKLLTSLSRTSLAASIILFLCQFGSAACLCRPVSVLGGILVSLLFLFQGIFGNYVINIFSQTLLVGYACLSAFVSLSGLASALYLLSGQFTIACISTFHRLDHHTGTRLGIVEGISLVASVPCLLGAIACFLSAVLSARASKTPPKNVREPQLFLYLQPSPDVAKNDDARSMKSIEAFPSAPVSQDPRSKTRAGTPPPSYNQLNEESYA